MAMTQWQYAIRDIRKTTVLAWPSQKATQAPPTPKELMDELNELGVMGWELVSLDQASGRAIFKRPKQ